MIRWFQAFPLDCPVTDGFGVTHNVSRADAEASLTRQFTARRYPVVRLAHPGLEHAPTPVTCGTIRDWRVLSRSEPDAVRGGQEHETMLWLGAELVPDVDALYAGKQIERVSIGAFVGFTDEHGEQWALYVNELSIVGDALLTSIPPVSTYAHVVFSLTPVDTPSRVTYSPPISPPAAPPRGNMDPTDETTQDPIMAAIAALSARMDAMEAAVAANVQAAEGEEEPTEEATMALSRRVAQLEGELATERATVRVAQDVARERVVTDEALTKTLITLARTDATSYGAVLAGLKRQPLHTTPPTGERGGLPATPGNAPRKTVTDKTIKAALQASATPINETTYKAEMTRQLEAAR